MFKELFKSSVSACFELDNDLIYYSDKEYDVFVNGESIGKFKTNVFSLFSLKPSTDYEIKTSLSGFSLKLTTLAESVCVSVKQFGAAGDGTSLDTHAIQNAINLVKSGGRVVFPKGKYLTAPIVLKSDITIELEKGAKIIGSTETSDYSIIPGEVKCQETGTELQCISWEGDPIDSYQPLISANHASNVSIVGEGEIDGNAPNGIWYLNPKEQTIGRPRLIFVNDCTNFVCHGITGGNSASWNFHSFFSKNIGFYDIKIYAEKDSPNTDGCNPESCDGVKIIGVKFSVGDDCIALKSGKIYMGAKYKTPCQNIVIRNCLMHHGHGAIVLGSEMAGGIKNIEVSRCLFRNTDRGLRIKTRRGRGKDAIINDVRFSHIKMENVLTPLVINMFYFCDPDGKTEYVWSKEKQPVDERTPYMGKFHFSDMECDDCEYAAGFFYGLPEKPIEEIVIENVNFKIKKDAASGYPAMMSYIEESSKQGVYFNNVNKVRLKNVTVTGQKGEKFLLEKVNNYTME